MMGLDKTAHKAHASLSSLYPFHTPDLAAALIRTANALVQPRGRGIYIADETSESLAARMVACKPSWADSDTDLKERGRAWRECIYSSLHNEHISGIVLDPETLHDSEIVTVLKEKGVIPGVRADVGTCALPGSAVGEPVTQGLDNLLSRMQHAHSAGARFSCWHTPIMCNANTLPTALAIETQADSVARFAAMSQQAGLVPIAQVDVSFAEDASLERSAEINQKVLSMVYARCNAHGVLLEGSLLQCGFAQPGLMHSTRANTSADVIAHTTASILARTIPIAVAGVVFSSGATTDDDTVDYISAINNLKNGETRSMRAGEVGQYATVARLPRLSFALGHELQGDAMVKWAGGDEQGAREAFGLKAEVCYRATRGEMRVSPFRT